jgi:hypothetical protein
LKACEEPYFIVLSFNGSSRALVFLINKLNLN